MGVATMGVATVGVATVGMALTHYCAMAKANTHSTHVNNANSHYSLPRAMENCLVFFTHFTSMLLREQILLPPPPNTHTKPNDIHTHTKESIVLMS